MSFCYQETFFKATRPVDAERFQALVCAPWWHETVYKLRQLRAESEQLGADSDRGKEARREADRLKRTLPAFVFQATFDETLSRKGYSGRWRKQSATRLTGLVVMDIDHVDDPRAVFQSWQQNGVDFKAEGILLVYITPSGHGLKVVFKARTEWGNLIDNQHAMAALLGVSIDESCKDASRLSFIPIDEDILYINQEELFSDKGYGNESFIEKYTEIYRNGSSQPTLPFAGDSNHSAGDTGDGHILSGQAAAEGRMLSGQAAAEGPGLSGQAAETDNKGRVSDSKNYRGVSYETIIKEWLGGKEPLEGDRHTTLLKLVTDLRYICDNRQDKLLAVVLGLPWVKQLQQEGDNIEAVVTSAMSYKFYQTVPRRMAEALRRAGVAGEGAAADDADPMAERLDEWGAEIERMADTYPCLKAIGHGLRREAMPAALFVSAAFLGTCMTRTWYHFYHRPEEERRLNYCVMIIGDPASGKSFATRLYRLLAAPLISADSVANDAINRYKRERKERATSTKEQKKEALKKPEVIVRIHGTRTANGVFIADMNGAIDHVGQREIHLHLLTFDAELDASTAASKGGQWIDKSTMELKAFHNEEDSQQYMNDDSVSGPFNVYWNYVYTGTPLSLQRKVTERNFGSGLSTRLACIPFPRSNCKMMELRKFTPRDQQADEELKTWAYRLDDKARGELPLWPLVEQAWEWTRDRLTVAAVNNDRADELLIKRVPYYGIAVATPFVVMRHWDTFIAGGSLPIDDEDRRLCELVMDIQYTCQQYFFGAYARAYFDNMERDLANNRVNHTSRYALAYNCLPDTFTLDDVQKYFEVNNRDTARVIVHRLKKDGSLSKGENGTYRKIKKTIS